MNKFLLRWIINSLAVWAAVYFVPGINWTNDWVSVIGLGLILTLVNAIVRPLAKFVGCLPIILTLGLFTLVVNALTLWLSSSIAVNWFHVDFHVHGFWAAFWGALIVSLATVIMSALFKDKEGAVGG